MLRCGANADTAMSLLRLPFPSLVHLEIRFASEHVAHFAVESFSEHSKKITELHVNFRHDVVSPLRLNPES